MLNDILAVRAHRLVIDLIAPVFLNIRDMSSNIQSVVMAPPPPGQQTVPTFGACIDSFFDSFGYPTKLVVFAYDIFLRSHTRTQFAAGLNEVMSRKEAEWIWNWAERIKGHVHRRRAFNTPM